MSLVSANFDEEDEVQDDGMQVAINPDIKGYWESEIIPQTKPTWTYLALSVQQESMDIMCRSRKGDYMVCCSKDAIYVMKQSEKWWGFVGEKISYVKNEMGDTDVLNPMFVKNSMVTDKDVGAQFYRLTDDSTSSFIEIEPNTVLLDLEIPGYPRVVLIQIFENKTSLFWMTEEETLTYKSLIAVHSKVRTSEIQQHFFNASMLVENNKDFITVYTDAPSITSQVKTQGRAPYSIDKGPRAVRSATLKQDDEVFCISVAIVVLYTCNADGAYDKWSLNRIANEFYRNTKAFDILCKSRGNNNLAVTNQLRRWLPFCRELAKRSRFFSTEQCPFFSPTPQNTDMRIKWMNKRGPAVFEFIKEWIEGGEKSSAIISGGEASMPIKEWYVQRLKYINEVSSPSFCNSTMSHFQSAPVMMQGSLHEDSEMDTSINVIDLIRVQTLTTMAEKGKDEAQKKKTQRLFQSLAQNIVSHKRNFKGLVESIEKASSILMRMQTLEQSINKNMSEIGGDDIPNIAEMKRMVYENIQSVETDAKSDIRESLEPLVPFLTRKKLEGELDDFISYIITYSESASKE